MRKYLFLCLLLIPTTGIYAFDLDYIRVNYFNSVNDRMLCKNMIVELENVKSDSAIYLAYLGGLQVFLANHVFSPFSKLSTFNKGKKNIEEAISKEPNNIEIHFIRLSIQMKAPLFLGYSSNVAADTEFIENNRRQIKSILLKNNIELLLKK